MAYASCNGFSSPKYMKGVDNRNIMWERMRDKHAGEPYHLLLLGGDQVYADPIWDSTKAIRAWYKLDTEKATRDSSPPRCSPKPSDSI